MVNRSPKVGMNQLSSMEFRGLASDCVCNHRTPPLRYRSLLYSAYSTKN